MEKINLNTVTWGWGEWIVTDWERERVFCVVTVFCLLIEGCITQIHTFVKTYQMCTQNLCI